MLTGISTSRPTLSLLAILCTLIALSFLYKTEASTLSKIGKEAYNHQQIKLTDDYNQSLDTLPNSGQKKLIKEKLLQLEQLQRSMELATDVEKETYAKSIKAQRDEFIKAVKLAKGLDTTTTRASARMMPAVIPCPEMQVIELLGIPGFAATDELVICGAPDTLAFLMFIEEPGNISGTQMTASFLPGMQYAGFEETRYGTTTISNLDPTPSNPKFLLEGITEGVYIGYIGVEATCDADINAFDYSVGLDFNFIYEDTLGNFQRCRQSITPIRAYNSVIKEPVLNFRSTSNTTVTSLATETCTTIQISQDGIDAYLTEVDFSICNVDFANELSLTSISANGTSIPYVYNAADSTVMMTIGGSYFQNNSRPNPADTLFDESEFLNIRICMQIDECPNVNTQYVTYKASYDCYGEVCQIIQQQREIRVRPTDRPEPIATSELVQQPGVCGTPAVMELNLTSSIADSAAGIFTDLAFGYETCQSSSLDISKVTIGGMPLPATAYSWNNGDILIDLTTLATDPDGPGGIQDADFDGFYDDLPGGEAVVVRIELDFQCNLPPDPSSIDCASIDCSFGQFFITAKRDCGQAFTFEPPVSDFSIRNGATYVELKNQDQINTSTIGYNFGTTRTSGATCSPLPVRVKTIEFCYIYETENVAACDPANTTNELQVVFDGSPRLVYDVEFVAGSGEMTVNGVTTQTGATGTFTDLSASSRVLSLPIGELNEGDEVCYIYQLAADSASCSPAIYMNGVHQVIETCSSGGCTCKTVKACDIALFRSDPSNCGCTCDIASGATIRRWNLGYTDEKMTKKVALEDVPAADLNRYLPCDTMLYEGYMTFNSPESVGELYQWYFVANITNIGHNGWAGNDDTELMIDSKGTKLLGLDFSSGDGSGRVPIDVGSLSECLDQPGGGATGFFSYGGETPWSDATLNRPMPNSSYEYHDGNLFGVYFRNFNKLEECRDREVAGWEEVNCLDQLKATYGIGVGDTIYMKWLLPLTKNVKAFANKTADPSFTFKDPQIINVASGHFLDEFDSDCLVGLSNCRTNSPFTTFCPEDLNAVTEIKLDDCGGSVEHKFNVVKPTPVNWYTAEYRPFFKMEDIEVPMYSPLIYCGNAKLVTKCGVEYPLDVQSMTNHDCATVNGQEYCTVSNGTEGAITFNPETNGYPGLGVGLGGYVDDFKIVYDLCKVCPAESPDLSDYEITYDYRICEPVNGICFRCNQATNGTSNELPMVCGPLVNRLASYYDVLNMDTLYRWDDVTSGDVIKTDTSKGFPPLTQTQDQNLLASSSPGTSEELNTFTVCADGSDMSLPTHMGVLSSVTLTNSVELVGAYDAAGNPLVFDTVSTSATSNTYAVFLPDLAPGDCMTFTIGTRLLFCPVPPDVPEICVTTTSGCMDRDIMAALAGITSNCNSIETCYEYIFEEAAIQADFLLPNAGDTYALCDTIPLAVLVKNVKGTTVKDLILDIDLPLTGMEIIPGSFEASYPNSGDFTLPFYSIVDPAINGNNLLYSEDNDFSNAIHSNGLPGVTSAGDSNFVVVRFNVETICDEFVSGSQASFEATAKDPCSPSTISSGLVTSNAIIINGGNPADFGQILITAKPSEAFCGQETPTFKITGQNISEKPLGDSVIMCVTLPAGINYQAGSMRYVIPTNLNVGIESVTTVNGQTQICFQGYENMPVGGAFTLNFEADFDVAAMCGDYDIQVDTKNLIEDQSCTDGGECDVFVQSSVNPNFTMTLKGPLETVDLKLFRQCDGNDDPVTICYEVVLRNPGPDYNGDVLVNLHDDLQANQTLDFYDPILGTGSHTGISVTSGDSITLTGCYTVDEINSCPVILDMVYDSPCACNHLATPYATIEPEFTAVLPPTTVLCPGQELGLELCGNFDIAYDPASNIVTRMVGDSLYMSVVDQSIVTRIDFTGTAGECSVDETRFIRGVEDFDLDIADSLTCQNQELILEPTIPIEYQDFITVKWTPATNLDDATLINPLFSSAVPGLYGYKIELEFNGGCILTDSVTVEVKPVGMINITGNNTICYPYETNTLTATAGYDYYEWYLLDGGFEIIQASTVPETWTGPTEPGKYIVKGFRSTDMCPSASDTIMIMQADCVDLELEKTICEIDAVPNFGDTISYQIDVCNRRDADSLLIHDAEMVQVTDMLPAGVMFVSYTATQGTYTPGGGGLWDIGTMASGACHTLKIKAKLIDYGKQINTAEISNSSKEDIDSEENNDDGDQSEDDEDMAMFTLETFDLALKKVICPSTMVPIVNLGDNIMYCITVENQGQVDAYNISVVDHPAPEIMPIDPNWVDSTTFWAYHSIDSIPAGQSVTIMFLTEIVGVPTDSFANNFSEILTAEDAEGDHPTDIDSTPDSDEMNDGPFVDNVTDNTNGDEDDHDPARLYVRIVDLALKKTTAITQPVKVGQDIPYTITVYNQGNIATTNIKVTEYIPPGLDLNAGLSSGWMDMDSVAMFLVTDTVGVGDSIQIPITMTVLPNSTSPTDLINVAEISSFQDTLGMDITNNDMDSDGDTDPNNDDVPNPGDPDDNNIYGDAEKGEDEDDSDPEGLTVFDLALKKTTADPGPFSFDDVVTFDFTVYNQGNVPAKNIEITEVTPCGYMVAPSSAPLWSTTGSTSQTTITNTIQPGDSFIVSIDLIIQPCDQPDAYKNTGEISASQDEDGNDTTDSDIDSDADGDPSDDGPMEDNATDGENGDEDDSDFEIIEVFDLALTKTILTPGPYQYGSVIEFEITVHNQGNVPAANITVADSIPAGYSFAAGNNMGWSGSPPVVNYIFAGPILPLDSAKTTIKLTLENTGGGASNYTNIAEITMAEDTTGMMGHDGDSTPDGGFGNDAGGEPEGPTDNQTDGDGTDDEDDHDPAIINIFDLALNKTTMDVGPFKYGDVVTFDFTVYNQGNITANNIEITELTPCGFMVAPSNSPLWSTVGDTSTTTITSALAPGDSTVVSIDLIVQPCGNPTGWKNTGEISASEDDMGNDTSDDDIDSDPDSDPSNDGDMEDNATDNENGDEDDSDFEEIQIFDLAQIKEIVSAGPFEYGDTIHYLITVINQGNVTADEIYVFDHIPPGLIFDPTLNLDWTPAGTMVNTLIEDPILPGLTAQVELYLVLNQTIPGDADDFTNISEIESSEDGDGNDTSGSDADSTPDTDATDDMGGEPEGTTDNQTDGNGTDDEDDHDPAIISIFDLALKKTTTEMGPFSYGQTIKFDYTVYNQGNVPAMNIKVNDYIPCGYMFAPSNAPTWSLVADTAMTTIGSTIQPGDSTIVSIEFIIEPCAEVGAWKNVGEIAGSEDDEGNDTTDDDIDSDADSDPDNDGDMDDNTINNDNEDEDDSDFEVIEIFDLAQKKILLDAGPYAYGDTLTYEFTIYNQGNVPATNIAVTDHLPPGLVFVPSLNPGWTGTAPAVTNIITSTVLGADSIKIQTKLILTQTIGNYDAYHNISEISSATDTMGVAGEDIDSDPDGDPTNDGPMEDNATDGENGDEDDSDFEIIQVFDLALKKIIDPSQALPVDMIGDTVTYCIIVENQGTIDAQNISIADNPPSELTIIDTNWDDSTSYYAYNYINSLLVGEMDTIKLSATINAVPSDSFLVNYAEILDAEDEMGNHPDDIDSDADSDPTNDGDIEDDLTDNTNEDEDDHDPAILHVRIVDLALKKQTTVTTPVKVGQDIPYTITVYNQGNVHATQIKVSEYIPAGLDLNLALSPGWMDMDSIAMFTITDTLGFMDSMILNLYMTVLPNNTNPADLINVAEISSFRDTMNFDITYNDQDSDGDTNPDNDGVPAPGDPDDDYVDGDGDEGEDEDDSDPEGLTVFDLALKKTTVATGPFTYGDTITFDFTVYNQGNVPAKNIEVTEVTPCGYEFVPTLNPTWPVVVGNTAKTVITDTLNYGDSAVVSMQLIVQPCAADDAWRNTGEISKSQDQDGNDTTDDDIDSDADDNPSDDGDMEDNATNGENGDEDDSDFEKIEVFDLALKKVVLAPTSGFQYGDTITYGITVYNQGNVPATNITIADSIPAGLLYVAGSNSGWTGAAPIVTYTITDTLEKGESVVIPIKLVLSQTAGGNGNYTNIAEISMAQDTMGMNPTDADSSPDTDFGDDEGGEPGGPTDDQTDGDGMDDEDDHDPAIVNIFDLALNKTTTATGPFRYGDIITFDIEVTNQGNVPSTNIEVTDVIPCGYKYVQANNPLWTETGNIAKTIITDTLQGGDSKVVSIELVIQPCMGVDGWRNTAEISGSEDDEGNDTTDDDIDSDANDDPSDDGDMEDNAIDNENGDEDDSDFEDIQIFDLALTKKVVNPLPFYIPGDTVEYKIAVYNQGNTTAYDLQIGDYLPTGLVFPPAANTAAATGNPYGWVSNGAQVTTNIDSLNVSDSTCLTLKFLIGYSFRGNQIINYAEIGNAASDIGGPNETDADSDADTNNNDTGGNVETGEDDHIDDDGTDTNGDGITDEDDHDPAIIEVRAFSTRILNACNCLENGYAQDEVTIYSPIVNDVWTIAQNTGMLNNGLSPIPLNTNVTYIGIENGYYVYKLIVTHQSGIGYTGVFANGLTTLTVSNICNCPTIITSPDGIPPPADSIPTITQTLSKTSIAENKISCAGTAFENHTVHSLYVDTAACRTAQTLCPMNQWQRLKITFSEFDLAAGDTLCVFEGKDTLGTPIAKWSGAGISQTGGWIGANCDPDINPSGCLTFLFKTNGDNSKGLGWRSTATCDESDIVLNAEDLQVKLACEQTHQVFTIRPATVVSGCTGLKDSQFVRIYNTHEELCKDTCLAIDKTFDLPFAIGQYKVEYKLKSDTVKSTTATISVQETAIVCNDEITIPMGGGCSIAISPDDLLENPCDTITDTVYYFITLKGVDKNGKEIVLASGGGKGGNYPVVTKDMIDQCNSSITATIERRYYEGLDLTICNSGPQHISCIVKVNIKDELAPVFGSLAPADTLVTCTIDLTQTGLGLTTPVAFDNCGTATVTFGGAEITTPSTNVCDTTRAIISWMATDECGNTATTTQQVVIVRPQLADIVKTGIVNLACDSETAIDISATIPRIKTGRLKNGVLEATDTIALSTTEYICGYILQYTDTQIPEVDCGRKVIRNWTVQDWCDSESGPQAIDTTFIEFKDTKAPTFAEGAGANKVIYLDHQSCTYDVHKLAQPIAADNCSTPSVRLATVARIEDGATWELPITNWASLDCDSFQLTWIAADACHEQLINDTVTQIIVIQDVSKPSVNCTDNINLALGRDKAILHYTAIDAGSYDACGIAKYEVSRDEVNWDSIVTFDCQDIHVENKVYLRVIDNKGNQNTCWMTVNVEDKIMPICSNLPDVNTTCDAGHVGDGLSTTDSNENGKMDEAEWVNMTVTQATEFNTKYGQPNCSDNVDCVALVIAQQYQFIKKACGIATIKRRYRAIDWQGKGNISNWVEQTINVESKAAWVITLPADWKGECGQDVPDSGVTIANGACDLVGYETEEKVFTTIEDACLKVIRTFTITNWCKFEAGGESVMISRIENEKGFVESQNIITAEKYENVGQLTYVQILKVQDDTAPVITVGEVDNCIESESCETTKRFAIAAQDCNEAATAELVYNWAISANGNELATGQTSAFEYTVAPKVNYEVRWTVTDNCGNAAWETVKYEFSDCKKPAPYCIGGVVVQLMETGVLQVWASDFERGSTDNCTPKDHLTHRIWHSSLGEAPRDLAGVQALPEVITLDCANIGQQNINLYVIDEAGNWDFCTTSVIVQDNNNACENTGTEGMATVSGTIMDWNQKTVENTMVTTTTGEGYITNEDGLYHFELAMNKGYDIEPQKNDNPLNGVSTFDLVLISKHILNITPFDNPYQYIAADANKSGTITAFDMVQIRQLILNIKTEFTNNESWRFVVTGQDFEGANPLATDFAEIGQINNLAHDMLLDFVAVKVGDVNGNAKTNSLLIAEDRSPANSFEITTTDRYLKAGEQVSVTFATNQINDIQGYQFTLAYDNLQLEKLHSGLAGVENFGLHKMDEGWITTSWNHSAVGSGQSAGGSGQSAVGSGQSAVGSGQSAVGSGQSAVGSGQSAVGSGQLAVGSGQLAVLFTIDFTAKQNGRLSEQLSIIDKPTVIEAYSAGNNAGETAGELMNVQLTFTETIVEGRPFELFQNEPNPFDVNTSIGFYLPGDSEIVLTLRNEAGQILKVIKEDRTTGEHRINLENIDLPKGFIYYQLTTKYGAQAKKMLHLD